MQRCKWFGSVVALLMLAVFLLPQEAKAASFEYKNAAYGFSVTCPQEPVGVVDLSNIYPEDKGVVLIFANEGYDIKHAWIISDNGFDEADLPDFAKLSDKDRKKYFKDLLDSKRYDFTTLVEVAGTSGLYTITKDEPKHVSTYFRANNKRYSITLIDNPAPTKEHIEAYQNGVLSFKIIK